MFGAILGAIRYNQLNSFEIDEGVINDEIPRCLCCGMILRILPTDLETNLRTWCEDCKIVWLLPSNYFKTTSLNKGNQV